MPTSSTRLRATLRQGMARTARVDGSISSPVRLTLPVKGWGRQNRRVSGPRTHAHVAVLDGHGNFVVLSIGMRRFEGQEVLRLQLIEDARDGRADLRRLVDRFHVTARVAGQGFQVYQI